MSLKRILAILLCCFSLASFGQWFRGVDHLDKYEPRITKLDKYLTSNPKKYKELYPELRKEQFKNNDKVLEAALDIFQGSYHYFTNGMDSATYYFDKAMLVSTEIGQDQLFRSANIRRIFCDEYKKTKFQMSEEMKAIYAESYNQHDTINMLYSLNGLGIFFSDMDSISLALQIYYEAMRLAERSNNLNELGFIHNNLGLLKYDLGAHDSAFSDFKRCKEIGEELGDVMLQAIGRQNMGLYYNRIDSFDLAKEQYLRVNKMGNEFGYILYSLSSTTNLAALEMQLGNAETSDSLSDLALKIAKDGQVWYGIPSIYFGKAYYGIKTEQYEEAHRMLDSAYVYCKYGQYSEVMPPYYLLRYRAYEEQGDYEKAFYAYKEKVAVDDSLDDLGNAQLLSELQFRYDDEKKERIRMKEENKLKLQIKQDAIDMAKFRQKVIIGISVFAVIFLVIIVLYFRLKQKSDNLFSFTIANKLEEERGRIARDLHDGLGQSMIVLKNKFNKLEVDSGDEAKKLDDNFSEVIEEIRAISRSLIPPELRRLGLKKAVINMLEDIERSTGMIVTFDIDIFDKVDFEEHQSIRLYRIIQELCTNTVKHAGASSIKLEAVRSNGDLLIIYQDNGAGLDMEKWRSAENSVGFKSIQQRLKYLKGSIKVEKPKIGFKVELKIPES